MTSFQQWFSKSSVMVSLPGQDVLSRRSHASLGPPAILLYDVRNDNASGGDNDQIHSTRDCARCHCGTACGARAEGGGGASSGLVGHSRPAGWTDARARLIQTGLQQRLGATIIIENKAGASGSVGTAVVAKAPPDGNTWLMVFDNHGANPF